MLKYVTWRAATAMRQQWAGAAFIYCEPSDHSLLSSSFHFSLLSSRRNSHQRLGENKLKTMATFSITLTFTPSLSVTQHFDVSKKDSLTSIEVVSRLQDTVQHNPLLRHYCNLTLMEAVSLHVYEIDGEVPQRQWSLHGSRWLGLKEALRRTERSMNIEWYRKLSLFKGMSDAEAKCIARPSFNSSVDRFSDVLALFVDLTTSIVVNSAGNIATEELFLKSFAEEMSLHVLPKQRYVIAVRISNDGQHH